MVTHGGMGGREMWLGDGEAQLHPPAPTAQQEGGREGPCRVDHGHTGTRQAEPVPGASLSFGHGAELGFRLARGGDNSRLVSGHRAKGQVLACSPVAPAPSATITVRAVGCGTGQGRGGKAARDGPEKPLQLLRGGHLTFLLASGAFSESLGEGAPCTLGLAVLAVTVPLSTLCRTPPPWEQWIGGLC